MCIEDIILFIYFDFQRPKAVISAVIVYININYLNRKKGYELYNINYNYTFLQILLSN